MEALDAISFVCLEGRDSDELNTRQSPQFFGDSKMKPTDHAEEMSPAAIFPRHTVAADEHVCCVRWSGVELSSAEA